MSISDSPRESATVVILRDAKPHFEVLMLRKNRSINYGGSWVFPGGVVDPEDNQQTLGPKNRENVARTTVIRETREETGLAIDDLDINPFANWLTPKIRPKRYNALFFVTQLHDELAQQAPQIDGEEIIDARWITPDQALEAQANNEFVLNGPAFVTLHVLKHARSCQEAIDRLCADGITAYNPRGFLTDDGAVTVYPGDAAYPDTSLNAEKVQNSDHPQHRLVMRKQGAWQFIDTR